MAKTAFMTFVAAEYAQKAGRCSSITAANDNNTSMYQLLGPDTGYDCINNYAPSSQMADFLNALNMASSPS